MSQLANRCFPGHRSTAGIELPGEDANRLLEFGMGRLLSFVCLAEELHFGRTAQKLNISQPALSQQIAHLERALKAPLFWRGRRSVTLTPAGRTLLRASRWALGTMMAAVGTASATGSAAASPLLLSYTPGSPPAFVDLLCERLSGQLLGMPVSPGRHGFAEQVALIAEGTAFAGVTHLTRALLDCTEVSTSVIGADPFVPAAAVAVTWAPWASRAESTRLVQHARAVWQDMGLTTADFGPA